MLSDVRTALPTAREALAAGAALTAGALAAFVLTNPRSRSWAVYASDRELDRWLSSQPTGVVVGVVLAVIAVAGLQRSGSRRTAWVLSALCVIVLAAAHWTVPDVGDIDTLIALHFGKTAAAGVLLGASVAGSWGARIPQIAVVLGVSATYVLAGVQPPARGDSEYLEPASLSTSAIGEPSWVLLGAAFVLTLAAAVVARKQFRVQRLDQPTLLVALGGALTLAVANRLLGAWIEDQEFGSQFRVWTVVVVSLAIVLALTVTISRMLPGLDGAFVLATTAVAAGAITVINDLRAPSVSVHPWLALVVGVVAVACGMRLPARSERLRNRQSVLGIAVVAVVPLVSVVAPEFGSNGALLIVRLAVLGIGVGLAVGGSIPGAVPVAALALALPFGSLVFAAATTIPLSRVVSLEDLGSAGSNLPSRLAGAAMFATVLVCGAALARHRSAVRAVSEVPSHEDSGDSPPPETP